LKFKAQFPFFEPSITQAEKIALFVTNVSRETSCFQYAAGVSRETFVCRRKPRRSKYYYRTRERLSSRFCTRQYKKRRPGQTALPALRKTLCNLNFYTPVIA
jgi:hypothetical protein